MPTLLDWFSQFWAVFVANRENIVSLGTLIGGGIGIVLLSARTYAANRSARAALEQAEAANRSARAALEQAKTATDRHDAQTNTDRERRITESFAKAAELLGSEKLATRLGGIYTLERLSHESEREYWAIMETLTAYVREHAPWPSRQAVFRPFMQLPGGGMAEIAEQSPRSDGSADQEKEPEPSSERIGPATDVQAILTVLKRRKEEMRNRKGEDQCLNLSTTDLRGADLEGAHLEEAILIRTRLEGAYLGNAYLEGAYLMGAYLKGANLMGAHLEDADLMGAHLEDADLKGAHLEGAYFKGANFMGAHLERAKLLTQEQIDSAFGDENTTLPEGLKRPAHWTSSPEGTVNLMMAREGKSRRGD